MAMTATRFAATVVVTGLLIAIAGAGLAWGPEALVAGGLALAVFGFVAIDVGGRDRP